MEHQGKRVAQEPGEQKKKRTALLIICVVFALFAGSYLGLCSWVSASSAILPKTTAAGVDLSGLTREEAERALADAVSARYGGRVLSLRYRNAEGLDTGAELSGKEIAVDAAAAAAAAYSHGRGSFLSGGAGLVSALLFGYEADAPLCFPDDPNAEINLQVEAILKDMGCGPVVESSVGISEQSLLLSKGVPGLLLDADSLKASVLQSFHDNAAELAVSGESVLPADPDFDALYERVYTEARSAQLDRETYEIIPHVTGISFDTAAAREQYGHTGWGSLCEIPFTLSEPELTTEELEATLFSDVLGQATSEVGGTANRKSNVTLSAAACNDRIIIPGGVFSYNTATGSRTEAAGYLPAPAYVQGLSVDEIGGGICQTSSTIYYAALNANLKIVERHNHTFAVGYVPDGMDATVYYGSLDFRFENDTAFPLKIVTESYTKSGRRYLTVTLYGTKTDTTYVKMTNEQLSSTPWTTVYKPDASIPVGTLKEDVTPYTGRKVNAYRNVYDESGTLISQTLESVSNYKKRDRVYLFNPADAGKYSVDPATGLPVIAIPTPTPSDPGAEPSPGVTPEPTPGVDPSEPVSTPPTPEEPIPSFTPPEPSGHPDDGQPSGLPFPEPDPVSDVTEE